MSPQAEVGLVVPTLGQRRELLDKTLGSIRDQALDVEIVIVAPTDSGIDDLAHKWKAVLHPDPGGLVQSINAGVDYLLTKPNIRFVGWLNDDDLLEPHSMATVCQVLDRDPRAVVAFGACRYIDADGRELFVSRAGSLAPRLLSWGPDLIPQPGMLIASGAWRRVGGLDASYRLAFDLDLLLRLKRLGRLRYAKTVVSSFRWHPDSLTVDDRERNLAESERAKRASLPKGLQRIAWLWEVPVRVAIRSAAARVNARSTTN